MHTLCFVRYVFLFDKVLLMCKARVIVLLLLLFFYSSFCPVAEWLACWTQAQKGPGSNRSCDAVGNSLRQIVHIHRASVHQAAKYVAALLRVAGVTAGLAESNDSLPPGL